MLKICNTLGTPMRYNRAYFIFYFFESSNHIYSLHTAYNIIIFYYYTYLENKNKFLRFNSIIRPILYILSVCATLTKILEVTNPWYR